ncbi:MAG TPA: DUF2169 domain-containing protein [Myxococcaceae bacterium]|nr:DUF2169 domain-containing protein [Myxococcaceae bacterium]
MGQPVIENRTPFSFETMFVLDEEGRPLLVPILKATYAISREGLVLADEQRPVELAGVPWGEPEQSSYRYEPECALWKVATDVVLVGAAVAPDKSTTELLVALQMGALRKTVRVTGDRTWYKSLGRISMTRPLPFERIPLRYERAFGGWDRSASDPKQHRFDGRNPVGTGFRANARNFQEGLRLPNLEDPRLPLREFGQVVPVACFGFTSPHWQPRSAYGGTYDEAWTRERMPLLPKNFDRRFFSAASEGLVAPGYLNGREPVTIINASSAGRLAFTLPGVTPRLRVERVDDEDVEPALNLDTVILDTEANRVFLLWRGNLLLDEGPPDLVSLEVTAEGLPPST